MNLYTLAILVAIASQVASPANEALLLVVAGWIVALALTLDVVAPEDRP